MDGLFSRERVASAMKASEAAREGWRLHHPARIFPTGCAGAATRIIQRDLPGLLPRFFLPEKTNLFVATFFYGAGDARPWQRPLNPG